MDLGHFSSQHLNYYPSVDDSDHATDIFGVHVSVQNMENAIDLVVYATQPGHTSSFIVFRIAGSINGWIIDMIVILGI